MGKGDAIRVQVDRSTLDRMRLFRVVIKIVDSVIGKMWNWEKIR